MPLLRGLSPMRRGVVKGFAIMLFCGLASLPMVHAYASDPSRELLTASAQVGATLLIAYGVEISWFIKESRLRGANRQNWVGVAAGLGGSGMIGIAIALALSAGNGGLGWIEAFGFSWALFSIGALGGLVAFLPVVIYEFTHIVHAEYPDE